MSKNFDYSINDTTKWSMLTMSGIFDIIQIATPTSADYIITAIAGIMLTMIFIEHGALTIKASRAMRMARYLVVPLAVFASNLPEITMAVYIQIEISRAADRVLPDVVRTTVKRLRMRKTLKKYKTSRTSTKYGKGRRGHTTLNRQQQTTTQKTSSKQRRLQNDKL